MKKVNHRNLVSAFQKSIAVITSIAVATVMFVMPLQVSAYGTDSNYAGGTGSYDDPYLISNVQQLEYFRDQVNSGASQSENFRLTADIDLSGLDWVPIGSYASPFHGNFDGGGHTISNLTIGSEAIPSTGTDLGLFGYVDTSPTVISYLNVSNAVIYSSSRYAGVIAGELGANYNYSLYDCHASGQIICTPGDDCAVGGLVGYIQGSKASVNECSSSVSVTGNFFSTGGLVGINLGTVQNSWSSGMVCSNTEGNAAAPFSVGGLVGSNCNIIENSYFTGTISDPYASEHFVGEIAGSNNNTGIGALKGTITNCYANFVPQSPMNIGGVTGNQESTASNSHNYWCTDGSYAIAQAVLTDFGITTGDLGISAADMKTAAFITELNTSASGQSGWYLWQAPAAGENGDLPILIIPGHSAELSSLKIGGTEVGTTYASDTGEDSRIYNFSIPNGKNTMTVSPVTQNANANITVNGSNLSNGSISVTYYDGSDNQILITVTSPDGMRYCRYCVNVTQLPSSDATLSAITVGGLTSNHNNTGGTLSPAFDPDTTDYTMDVPYNTDLVSLLATTNSNAATVSVNGGAACVHSEYATVPLGGMGTTTTVTVTVTAQDSSQKTYTIHVTRQIQSTRELSSLGISSGTLSPAFSPDNFYYILTMPTSATGVSLTPVDTNIGDTITINNQSVNSNEAYPVNLTPGTAADIGIYVQPHDGSGNSAQYYAIHVTWEKSSWLDAAFVAAGFGGGAGTQSDPYLIATPGELAYLAQQVSAGNDYDGTCFKLTADLNLSGREWVPIGNRGTEFSGTFDGNGHTISNVTIGTASDPDVSGACGLFGYLGSNGVIRDLSVNAAICTTTETGIVAGVNEGTIDGCSSSGSMAGNSSEFYSILGGVTAENYGMIENSYSGASLTASGVSDMGGITGDNYGEIVNCYSTGSLETGEYGWIGGIAGYNDSTIINCYARSTISAGDNSAAGGVAGYSDSDITNCYAVCSLTVGDISFDGGAGGVVGYADGGNYANDYWSLDAVQTVNGTARTAAALTGVGYGTDTAVGLHESVMADATASTTFAQQLTMGRTDTSMQLQWMYVYSKNNGFPVLDRVGDGVKNDAALSSLTVSAGTLSPTFSSVNNDYSVQVPTDTGSISITPVTDDFLASATVNGAAVTSGQASQAISLTAGQSISVPVVVTAQDGSKTTYTINITRAAADTSSSPSDSSSSSGSSSSSPSSSSPSSSSNSSSGSGVQITGTAAGGDSSDYTASISAQQAAGGSVTITLGGVTVKDTGSVLSGLIASTPGSSLRLTETPTAYSAEIDTLSGSNSIVSAFDINLFSVSGSGVSTQLHQLGGNITITLTLTETQKAQITDPSTAKLYYYDPDAKSLVDMHAAFDMSAGAVTFTTNHLSTFVLEQATVANPKTGSGKSPVIPLAILSACSASGLVIIKRRTTWKIKKTSGK